MKLEYQLKEELKRKNWEDSVIIANVKELNGFVFFTVKVNDRNFWATLTGSGKVKRNSVRIDLEGKRKT